ncbi:DUF3563 domain-containing protein [Oricola cellulosilytica]|uniref:DUF3563 domain-containing protein n=1 Tax=Oricola cellulosilytica TaxID=1429082 RepID=A0A4R0P281_9HYPH|nr:DUF3563 domain-containing protein [Oricola cellulosilytica]TCD10940.1 DUF3563 domain-containing protein [Oricola cellulosilytica]
MNNKRLANVFGRISGILQGPSRQQIETEYLNRSLSIHDLERRQREIDAGKFSSF